MNWNRLKRTLATSLFVALPSLVHSETITYTYDEFGEVIEMKAEFGSSQTFTYDTAGNRETTTTTKTYEGK